MRCLPRARLSARRAGRVEPPAYDHERDPETLMLNPRGIAAYAVALGAVIDRGELPVVLGGDCSILLGNLLALRRRGVKVAGEQLQPVAHRRRELCNTEQRGTGCCEFNRQRQSVELPA